MKRNTLTYIEENEKAYKYYIGNISKWVSVALPIFGILIVTCQIYFIRELFLEREAIEAASRTLIRDIEVTEWVKNWMQDKRWDWRLWSIIIVSFLMMGIVFIANWKIKSYDLYKKRWLKLVPTFLAVSLLFIIGYSYWYEQDSKYIILILITFFDLITWSFNFSAFLPLEIREDYNKFFTILSWIGEHIKKKM